MLRVRVRIDIDHKNSDILAAALNPDDLPWARCWFEVEKVKGVEEVKESEKPEKPEKKGMLIIDVESRIESVISAVDDFMVNLKAAVSVLEVLESPLSASDRESCQ